MGSNKKMAIIPLTWIGSIALSFNSGDFNRSYRRLNRIPEILSKVCSQPKGLISRLNLLIYLTLNSFLLRSLQSPSSVKWNRWKGRSKRNHFFLPMANCGLRAMLIGWAMALMHTYWCIRKQTPGFAEVHWLNVLSISQISHCCRFTPCFRIFFQWTSSTTSKT